MQTLKSVNRDKSRRQAAVSRQMPNVENLEKRELLTGGMLQGYAVVSNSGSFSMSDTPSTGVQIDLLNSSGTKVIAQTTTNSDGYYQFTNITPGNYILEEVQQFGINTTGVQANSLFDTGTAINHNTAIAVTVVNPSQLAPVTVSRNTTNPAPTEDVAYTLQGGPFNSVTATGDDVHQYQLTLSGSDLTSPTTIYSFCTDLFHADPGLNGNTYQLDPSLTPAAPGLSANIGQIGYLYNHFGTTALSATQGAGLQVAIWALLYNQTASLTSGNYQVIAPGPNSPTNAATFAAAENFLKISAGKSEGAFFLNNPLAPDTLNSISYTQGMIATENFDFTNASCQPPPCQPSPCQPSPCQPSPCQPSPCQPSPCQPAPPVCSPTPICPPAPPVCQPTPPVCQPTPPSQPCQPSQPSCGNNNNYGGNNNCQSVNNLICDVIGFLESFC